MSPMIFKYSVPSAIVVVALGAGAWYFLASPKTVPGIVPHIEAPGTIAGTTIYPSNFVPAQRVCAQSIADPLYERCIDVPEQEGETSLPYAVKVAPGTYTVYAALINPADMGLTEARRAYWTEFVRCGMTTNCISHKHLEVVVPSGTEIFDIHPHDWYEQ